jgi:hypothetical protein
LWRGERSVETLSGYGKEISMKTAALSVAMLALLIVTPAAAGFGWQRYYDPETGLRIDIPADVFTGDAGVPNGGNGRKLVTADGRANLTVQTLPNERGDTPAAFLASRRPPPGIVYHRVTPKFFVVSSFKDDKIFYDRCNFSGRLAHCVLINYPAREKSRWDGIVTRLSRSLAL